MPLSSTYETESVAYANSRMQAIVYFQRALKLNPGCLDAWCLVGHEFLELKNHHGAIEAYRRAVATDARDVRSWYSLGQAYEMMQMPYYALFYYRKAAQLTPDDARMWVRAAAGFVYFTAVASMAQCALLSLREPRQPASSLPQTVCEMSPQHDDVRNISAMWSCFVCRWR